MLVVGVPSATESRCNGVIVHSCEASIVLPQRTVIARQRVGISTSVGCVGDGSGTGRRAAGLAVAGGAEFLKFVFKFADTGPKRALVDVVRERGRTSVPQKIATAITVSAASRAAVGATVQAPKGRDGSHESSVLGVRPKDGLSGRGWLRR